MPPWHASCVIKGAAIRSRRTVDAVPSRESAAYDRPSNGYYWVRVISGGPPLRAMVAAWEDGAWWTVGEECSMPDTAVRVLAGPLAVPEWTTWNGRATPPLTIAQGK